jgi:hypothetical protein
MTGPCLSLSPMHRGQQEAGMISRYHILKSLCAYVKLFDIIRWGKGAALQTARAKPIPDRTFGRRNRLAEEPVDNMVGENNQ